MNAQALKDNLKTSLEYMTALEDRAKALQKSLAQAGTTAKKLGKALGSSAASGAGSGSKAALPSQQIAAAQKIGMDPHAGATSKIVNNTSSASTAKSLQATAGEIKVFVTNWPENIGKGGGGGQDKDDKSAPGVFGKFMGRLNILDRARESFKKGWEIGTEINNAISVGIDIATGGKSKDLGELLFDMRNGPEATQAPKPATAKKTIAAPKAAKKGPAAPPVPAKKTPAGPQAAKSVPAAPPVPATAPQAAKSIPAAPKAAKKTPAAPKAAKSVPAAPPVPAKSTPAGPQAAKRVPAAPQAAKSVPAAPPVPAKKTPAGPQAAKNVVAGQQAAADVLRKIENNVFIELFLSGCSLDRTKADGGKSNTKVSVKSRGPMKNPAQAAA